MNKLALFCLKNIAKILFSQKANFRIGEWESRGCGKLIKNIFLRQAVKMSNNHEKTTSGLRHG